MISRRWGVVIVMITAIAVGAALLRFSLANGSSNNWTPVHLPYPRPGVVLTDSFSLESGGRFELQIITPGSSSGSAAATPVLRRLQLRLAVTGPNGYRITRAILDLQRAGWYERFEMFAAGDVIELPSRGKYDIVLESIDRDPLFTERGAIVQLVRMQPVGPDLLYSVAEWAAYAFFVLAAVLAAAFVPDAGRVRSALPSRRDGKDH
jgi:hypothetical protein